MNPETYDKDDPKYEDDEDKAEEDYMAFVEWLDAKTADELRGVAEDPVALRQTLCRYFKRGYRANLTPSELIDFLGVSSPSIFDNAGYTEEQADAAMAVSDSLTEEEILGAVF